jgi:predicted GIY-YIG superfamily endonuclease
MNLGHAPDSPGCYLIYAGDQPFYAGMSKRSIRSRLRAHLSGRGSKNVWSMLAAGVPMYFEHYEAYAWEDTSAEEVQALEFVFMAMFPGKSLLPGNKRADNYRLLTATRTASQFSKENPKETAKYSRSTGMQLTYDIEVRPAKQTYIIRCHGELLKSRTMTCGPHSSETLLSMACDDIEKLDGMRESVRTAE